MWVGGVISMGINITLIMMLMMSNFIMVKITIAIKQNGVTLAAHMGGGGAYHGNPDPHHLDDDDDDDDDEQLHLGEDHDYNQTNWGQIKRRVRGFSLHQSRFRVVAVVPCAEVRCNLGDYHNHHHNYHYIINIIIAKISFFQTCLHLGEVIKY